jgi:hypothetical protein
MKHVRDKRGTSRLTVVVHVLAGLQLAANESLGAVGSIWMHSYEQLLGDGRLFGWW